MNRHVSTPTRETLHGMKPILGIVVTLLLVAGCGGTAASVTTKPTALATPTMTRIETAVNGCHLSGNDSASVGDGGTSVVLDGSGEAADSGELSIDDEACVLRALDVTDAVTAQMDDTNSLQGRQSGSWDGIDASWTYHPDNGLDIILTSTS